MSEELKPFKILYNNHKMWIMVSRNFKIFKYIKAEPPCNKGQIDTPLLTIGWQKESPDV